jgi:hypothetical protein
MEYTASLINAPIELTSSDTAHPKADLSPPHPVKRRAKVLTHYSTSGSDCLGFLSIIASLILALVAHPVLASDYSNTKLMVYQNIVSGNNQNPSWDWDGGGSKKEQRSIQIRSMPSGWDNAVSAVSAVGMGCQLGLFADSGFVGRQWWAFVPYAYLFEDGSMTEGFLGYDDMRKWPPGNDNISSLVLLCPDFGKAGLFLSSGVNGQPAMRGQDWLPGYAQSAWNYESGVLEVASLGAQSSIGNDAAAALYAWGQDCKIRLYRDDNFGGPYVDIWTDPETQSVIVPDLGLLPNVGRNQASSFRMECGISREW